MNPQVRFTINRALFDAAVKQLNAAAKQLQQIYRGQPLRSYLIGLLDDGEDEPSLQFERGFMEPMGVATAGLLEFLGREVDWEEEEG